VHLEQSALDAGRNPAVLNLHTGLQYLCCPACQDSMRMQSQEALVCTGCGARFDIVLGLPRFVAADNYAGSFGYQWNLHERTQLDSYTKRPISADRIRIATGWPQRLDGEVILEAGSGAGRFTEVLVKTGATVLSFDYSTAVNANARSNGDAPNLLLFQGDIFNIPCPPKSLDRVFCLGVLQHTPDPARAFRSLASRVKTGGQLVIDIYAKSWIALLHWRFLLRPLTKRMRKERLYEWVARCTPPLIPLSAGLRRIFGRFGARLLPISEFSHLGLPPAVNREWAILDTFDMLSPEFDLPQSVTTVQSWFEAEGFKDIDVFRGPNGVVARGTAP
jgi:SAM-dependent methyltransferase